MVSPGFSIIVGTNRGVGALFQKRNNLGRGAQSHPEKRGNLHTTSRGCAGSKGCPQDVGVSSGAERILPPQKQHQSQVREVGRQERSGHGRRGPFREVSWLPGDPVAAPPPAPEAEGHQA